ncbi:allantoinase AllB [Agromyces seonyuensis]|uniref:allantoinase n=1 Tax=Agromyces seonyuensis TaxID=2662446 RepID=A0A6I4P0J9_9MICO|nr:allantoinase AllB [Agromyces seonyuensis]MWB97529.1 allantoinase AllB [Agromyces seonyuensis]
MSDLELVISAGRASLGDAWRAVRIGIAGGRIATLDAPASPGVPEVVLAADEVLLPGLVDTHVHVNEPGRTEWEGFDSATRAAAAGGVTTLLDMPLNSIPPTIDPDALDVKRAVAGPKARIDVGFWGGAVPSNLGRLRELHDRGVFGFKCFLSPSGVDEFPHLSTDELHRAQAELAAFDGLLIVHAEDPAVLDAHVDPDGGAAYARFVASRPPEAETTAIEHVIAGLRAHGGRAHILHVSSARTLPLIAAAKAEGLRLTAETCPHYLTLDAEHIADGATAFKCCPPIRDEANRDALWAGLVDGTLDLIVSDHSPATAELKLDPDGDFTRAWGGISGLQLGLAAVWTEAARRGLPLEFVIHRMSRATADFAGLADRGRIEVGARADLVAFAPDRAFVVDPERLAHKNRVSAYAGAELRGVVARTWLAGSPVDADAPPRGILVERPFPLVE